MTSVELAHLPPSGAENRTGAWLLVTGFAATLFLSAFLLFSVQPMFTKMVLPVLGGSPGVWSVAMVFFQALLLGGYVWAHMLTRYLPLNVAAILHLALTAIALLALPIALRAGGEAPPGSSQAVWLIGVFTAAVGLPFFALSANGPLLQAWFARSGHPGAHGAYTLYGASNIGSFGALLAYPFLFEPFAGLDAQSNLWAWGYGALIICLAGCALLTLRGAKSARASIASLAAAPWNNWSWTRFGGWTLIAAGPSGLLVSVTAHISTDIASAPLLWVLPLALYLLTFVICFRDRFALSDEQLAPAQIFATLLMLVFMTVGGLPLMLALAVHLVYFFVSVLLSHRALYNLRPVHTELTAFYVAMSLGGLIGGVFTGLIAPHIFSSVTEYPILILASLLCQPRIAAALRAMGWRDLALPFVFIPIAWLAADKIVPADRAVTLCAAIIFSIGIIRWRSFPQAIACALALCLVVIWLPQALTKSQSWRSFFGVHKIREIEHMGARFRILNHGTTMHGAVRIDEQGRPTPANNPLPTTYYANGGPIAEALASVRAQRGGLSAIHAIGLGVDTLSCQRKPGEEIIFFEIDPEVIRLARNSALFNFVSACAPDARIVTGDARLTLARETKPADIVIVDAFSSDAIPVHLLTKEALGVYLSRLTPEGVLIFHISNNVMDLSKTIARVAIEHGLVAFRRIDVVASSPDRNMYSSSMVMAVARTPAHLGAIATSAEWKPIAADMNRRPWTDDYSTILEAIFDRHR